MAKLSPGSDSPVRLSVGLTGKARLVVAEADTAAALGSGDVPVLGTPRLLALCEEASMAALAGSLPEGSTSVAVRVQFNHLAAVPVGGAVEAEASLERVEGRRLTFTLAAHSGEHGETLVGAGRLVRVMVEREAFLQKAGRQAG